MPYGIISLGQYGIDNDLLPDGTKAALMSSGP